MRKVLKVVFGTVAVLLLLIVTAVTLLIVFFPTEKVRQVAQEQLSIRLRRQVVISRLSIHILKGIVVSGIRVSERPTFREGTFVEVKTVYCRYNLLEMLKAVLAARDPEALKRQTLRFAFVVDSPSVNIRRFVDPKTGQAVFNFSDLLPPPKPKAEGPKKPERKKKPASQEPPKEVIPEVKAPPLPFNLEIVELGVKNGRIELVDTATPRFKEVYTLNDVRFLVSGINLRRNSPMRLNTGFGLAVKEYKDGAETDVDVRFALDITGRFVLFDGRRVLNPTGDLFLTLADGKLTGVQLYRELTKEGRALTAKAEDVRKRYLATYEEVKRSLERARQGGGELARHLGGVSADIAKVQALADKVANADMGFIAKALDLPFLAETLTFDRLTARVHIRDQRAVSSNFEMRGGVLSARGRGWVGFNTTLDWDIILLGDRRYNNNVLTAAMATPEGDIALPVRITGTVAKPVVRFQVDLMPVLDAELRKRLGPEVADLVTGKVTVASLLRQTADTAREMVRQGLDQARQKAQEEVDAAKRRAEAEAEEARRRAEAEAEAARQEAQRRAEEERRRQEEAARQEAERRAQDALKKTGVKVPGF